METKIIDARRGIQERREESKMKEERKGKQKRGRNKKLRKPKLNYIGNRTNKQKGEKA